MATKEDLEAKAANCADGAEYAAVAMEALEDPKDEDYAKELMEQGEMSSSFPIHYVKLAEVAVALGDKDKANALYDEAEGMCFEAKEKVDVGFSIAMHLGDKEKGRTLIEEAMADTTDSNELLSLAGKIKEGLGDDDLANSIFDKITGSCKTLDDFKDLAKTIKEGGDESTAKMIFEKAESLLDGTDDVVAYATGFVELFDDKEKAEGILSGAEGDCMFPGQFVALAGGFNTLLDNKDKAGELLEQGKEFAMSGEENLDLAEGYAGILGDQDTAAGMYENAINDFSSKDDLLKLAGSVAANMDDKSIAAKAYEKVESNMTTVADLTMLAQAVNDDLGDKKTVAAIYERTEAKLEKPAELVALAGEVKKNLDDTDKTVSIYKKALDNSNSFVDTGKLLDAFEAGTVDEQLSKDTLDKALSVSEDAAQMLDIAKRASTLLPDDNALTLKAMDMAEENVSTLDEMRQLNKAAKEYAADDTDRLARVEEKLEKREASQAVYVEFQNKEKILVRPGQFIELAGDVVTELDDVSYASQLLATAEEKLKESGAYNQSKYLPLIISVSNLVKDNDWSVKLLDQAKEHAGFFAQIRELGSVATTQLADQEVGKAWAASLYDDWQKKLDAGGASTFEYLKLADAINNDLEDIDKVNALVETASAQATSPFHFAFIADLVTKLGDSDRASELYKQAATACTKASECTQLVEHMRAVKASVDVQKEVYAQGENLSNPKDKLQWAEGITSLFGDNEWATKAYDGLKDSFSSDGDSFIFANSKNRYLGERHFW